MSERTITLDELKDLVERVGTKLPRIAAVAMRASAFAMMRSVSRRISGPYLGVVTGTARRSIMSDVKRSGDAITARIGSPLGYVRAHEEGYQGPVQVRAHTRKRRRLEVGRKGTVTRASAKRYKKRRGPSTSYVRAHTRQVNMRARRFLRDTLYEESGQMPALLSGGGGAPFAARLIKAMEIYIEEERMPAVKDLGL